MHSQRNSKTIVMKERDTGSKPGDRQKNQEGGRGGTGTRPSGTGSGGNKPNNSDKKQDSDKKK
jgi:hypothetical protein